MAKKTTSADIQKKHIEVLGQELGSIYTALYNEVAWLHLQWDEYMKLFGEKHRVEILNKSAGGFFRMIQNVLSDDVILGIARLTDPEFTVVGKKSHKRNLTIQSLSSFVKETEKEELKRIVDKAMDAASFSRDWRNRRLAHRDLPLYLKMESVSPLPAASVDKIEASLNGLAEVIRFIGFKRFDTDIRFDQIIRTKGAVSLLHVLKAGLKKREERLEKLRLGVFPDEGIEGI